MLRVHPKQTWKLFSMKISTNCFIYIFLFVLGIFEMLCRCKYHYMQITNKFKMSTNCFFVMKYTDIAIYPDTAQPAHLESPPRRESRNTEKLIPVFLNFSVFSRLIPTWKHFTWPDLWRPLRMAKTTNQDIHSTVASGKRRSD